jgi:Flp pilus assembly pilin Flp
MQRLTGRMRRQRGQAYIEYFVVAGLIIAGLVVGGDTSVMNALVVALKSFFGAYSYALSLP